jgi:hypothetical protein
VPARIVAHAGSAACIAALVVLGFELAKHDRAGLVLIAVCLLGLIGARLAFVRAKHRKPTGGSS